MGQIKKGMIDCLLVVNLLGAWLERMSSDIVRSSRLGQLARF